MEKLIYPVFLQMNAAGYLVTIPDINQSVQSGNLGEGIRIAEELLGLWLAFLLDNEESVPKASGVLYRFPDKAFIYEVEAKVNRYRNKYKDYFEEDDDDE